VPEDKPIQSFAAMRICDIICNQTRARAFSKTNGLGFISPPRAELTACKSALELNSIRRRRTLSTRRIHQ
jgi:hypothetical protein